MSPPLQRKRAAAVAAFLIFPAAWMLEHATALDENQAIGYICLALVLGILTFMGVTGQTDFT